MYHRVANECFDPWGLAVTPANFADQLHWLSSNRTILSLDEFAARHRDGSLTEAAVALTFDDGYACTASAAAPLLERLAIPATVFLPVELVERGERFWWDELEDIVLGSDGDVLRLADETVRLGERRDDDILWKPGAPPETPRQAAFHRLWSLMRPLAPRQIDQSLAQLRSLAGSPTPPAGSKRPLTAKQIRATLSPRVQFGSHALTHPWLTSLSPDQKAHEIGASVERCEALTGSRPKALAYPYGNFDEESERLARHSGFACACATGGRLISAKSRLFALPRIHVGDWDSTQLSRALATAPL